MTAKDDGESSRPSGKIKVRWRPRPFTGLLNSFYRAVTTLLLGRSCFSFFLTRGGDGTAGTFLSLSLSLSPSKAFFPVAAEPARASTSSNEANYKKIRSTMQREKELVPYRRSLLRDRANPGERVKEGKRAREALSFR